MRATCPVIALGLLFALSDTALSESQPTPNEGAAYYQEKVAPILKAHCYSCHAAEPGGEVDSDFNLTTRDLFLQGGYNGPALDETGESAGVFLEAINYESLEMPPKGRLPQSQINILTKWIEMGAPWAEGADGASHHGPPAVDDHARRFWSFQPITRPELPSVKDDRYVESPVDAFVLARLESKGLTPPGRARKTTLLRRVYYSLTGLPPTPEEVEAFLSDDSPDAYERVVDRLLASRQYGERWGRHWLDLVRYAETEGYEYDRPKPEVWRYRDYVIDSFNNDKPYDQFLREQIAGDELEDRNGETLIATGFYHLGSHDSGAADKLQAEFDELDDIIATTGQSMLGLTMNCARCHDHKIDPIPTSDYYRMLAFFRGIERRRGATTRRLPLADGSVNLDEVERWEAEFDPVQVAIEDIERSVGQQLEAGERDDFEEESNRPAIVRSNSPRLISPERLAEYEVLLTRRSELERDRPAGDARALCVTESGPVAQDTHVLLRGSPYAEGDLVEPGFPTVITADSPAIPAAEPSAGTTGRRRVLADWIASEENPLTARVMANRVWHYHFNRGIVRTPNDFGFGGMPPTHPELLDWLASELIQSGWRLKPLHKLIVMSSSFQASSIPTPEAVQLDPENDLFSRFELRRLEAEELRDSVLAVSGNLNLKSGGPSIYPKISDEVLAGQSRPGQGWDVSSPEEQTRRSVYVHVKRSLLLPILAVFDAADTDMTCPVRFATTQPTQALALLNSDFLQEQATMFAEGVRAAAGDDPGGQVAEALRRVMQREPSPLEVDRGVLFMQQMQTDHGLGTNDALQAFCLMALNLNEFINID